MIPSMLVLPDRLLFYHREAFFASQLLSEAAHLAETMFQTKSFLRLQRDENHWITSTGYAIQALAYKRIEQKFPSDGLLAKEGGDALDPTLLSHAVSSLKPIIKGVRETWVSAWIFRTGPENSLASRYWILGNQGPFSVRSRVYNIHLGLIEAGKLVFAAAIYPYFSSDFGVQGALFVASHQGFWYLTTKPGAQYQLFPSDRHHPNEVIPTSSLRMPSPQYISVATGLTDGFIKHSSMERPLYSWDHIASLFVEAAGGEVTDLEGNSLDFSFGALLPHFGVVASNGWFHPILLSTCQKDNSLSAL
jgi:3'-phosphoadenosine 5'-phosphosulfate (PAPS) 3'-phosphatase